MPEFAMDAGLLELARRRLLQFETGALGLHCGGLLRACLAVEEVPRVGEILCDIELATL